MARFGFHRHNKANETKDVVSVSVVKTGRQTVYFVSNFGKKEEKTRFPEVDNDTRNLPSIRR